MDPSDPPPYTSSAHPNVSTRTSTPAHPRQPPITIPSLHHLNLSSYRIPNATVSPDKSTVTLYSKRLCSDPALLEEFLREQIALPPRPLVVITVQRIGEPYSRLMLDMIHHITAPHRNWSYVRIPGAGRGGVDGHVPGGGGGGEKSAGGGGASAGGSSGSSSNDLRFWVKRFCADPAPAKTLTLHRTLTHWDTDHLRGRLLALLTQLHSSTPINTLDITITFLLQHSTLLLHSWDKTTGFFSGITSFFTEPLSKRVEPVEVVWPYATRERYGGDEGGRREFILQSEDAWWEEWKAAIKHAVEHKRRGYVTQEDRLDALLAG